MPLVSAVTDLKMACLYMHSYKLLQQIDTEHMNI